VAKNGQADIRISQESDGNNMTTTTIVVFVKLATMVVVWFVLASWLFRRLREQHASTYVEIGSPSLFWNNSMRNNWLFLKFLFGSKWRQLSDLAVSNVCRFMRVFIVVYFLLFLALIALIPSGGVRHR
jgi:hypothetical protein